MEDYILALNGGRVWRGIFDMTRRQLPNKNFIMFTVLKIILW